MSGARLLILGAGGHGKVAGDCAIASGNWAEICFYDDRWPLLASCGPWSVAGTGDAFLKEIEVGGYTFVAIGDAYQRLAWLRRLKSAEYSIATVIHPRSIVSAHARIGDGGLVVGGAVINIGATIGLGCIINTAATVDHDCVLGDGVHICPGAHLAGDVRVGDASWIGIGCSVRQGIRIGAGVTVGAGAVVVADVPDGLTVVGVPARPVESKDNLD